MKIQDIKAGKTYRIRQWDDMVNEFGYNADGDIYTPYWAFLQEMKPLCGKLVHVNEILSVIIKVSPKVQSSDNWDYGFTPAMLEEIPEQTDPNIRYMIVGNGNIIHAQNMEEEEANSTLIRLKEMWQDEEIQFHIIKYFITL